MPEFYVRKARIYTEYEDAEEDAKTLRAMTNEPFEVVAVYQLKSKELIKACLKNST